MSTLNNLQLERPLVFLDLETTGVNTSTDRIVDVTVLKIFPDGTTEEKSVQVNPGIPIPPGATKVHGITDADVADKPGFVQYARSLFDFFEGCDLGGFNAIRFDIPMLVAEFQRVGLTFNLEGRNVVDPMIIFHSHEPRDLAAAYQKYCGEELEHAHSSAADVRAAAEVLRAQVSYYPDLPNDMAGLHDVCHPKERDWIDDQGKLIMSEKGTVLGFGRHQGRLLKELAITESDYLSWIVNNDFPEQVKQIVQAAMRNPGSDQTFEEWVREERQIDTIEKLEEDGGNEGLPF